MGPQGTRGGERAGARSLSALLCFVQAWARVRPGRPLRLTVCGGGLAQLPGEPCADPARAGLLAACRVIPQELPHLTCRAVDLDTAALTDRHLAGRLLRECRRGEERVIACRGAQRWSETFAPLPLAAATPAATSLVPGGVHLITGGLGELGLFLAEALYRELRARLVLVGRSPLPPRERWARLAQGEDRAAERLRRLLALEEEGAELCVLAADVADRSALRTAVATAAGRFGAIHGVLHLAGLTAEEHYPSVLDTGPEVCAAHERPKLGGLLALDEVLAPYAPEVCVAFSSLATVLGGLGYTAYTAANLAMDAAARERRRAGGLPWITIDWDGWLLDGLPEGAALGATHRMALTGEEGVAALLRILAQEGVDQVIVSKAPLAARLAAWSAVEPAEPDVGSGAGNRHGRPELSTGYAAPRDEFEAAIAEVWSELLGVGQIGIHDNFYELGGDSLLAIHTAARIARALGIEITGVDLLAAPTVAELTVGALEKLAASESDESLALELAAVNAELASPTSDAVERPASAVLDRHSTRSPRGVT